MGADIDLDARVFSLGRTEKSLDEPTASLPANEVARPFAALRRLRVQGVGMIYVSHRLDEVFEIADPIVVLRDGRVVGERATTGTSAEEVILLIVGRGEHNIYDPENGYKGIYRKIWGT